MDELYMALQNVFFGHYVSVWYRGTPLAIRPPVDHCRRHPASKYLASGLL